MDPRLIALTGLLAVLVAASVWSYRLAVAQERAAQLALDAARATREDAQAHAEAMREAAKVEAVLSPRETCALCARRVAFLQLVTWWDGADWLCLDCARLLRAELPTPEAA